MGLIAKQVWADYVELVKRQCSEVITNFNFKLERKFLKQELLNSIGLICSQYWFVPKVETTFLNHLVIIQAHFGHPKAWGTSMVGGPLLNLIILDE